MGVNSCGTTLIDEGTFKNIGAITWDTTVKTSGFTAVSGNGYFCNTASAAFTVTLPSSPSAGDVVAIADYANTFDTNNVIIGRNGSNIQGSASDFKAEIEGLSITLIYVDGTQGWLSIDAAQANDIVIPPAFTTATGGTITESGDFKIHTFTSPGTFTVTQLGNAPTIPTGGPSNVDYLVVAGGGAGASACSGGTGGGGGGGGHRTTFPSPGCNAGSFPITATGFPITVGAGGATSPTPFGGNTGANRGSNSIFSSITSTGGGGGAQGTNPGSQGVFPNMPGGSGGGGSNGAPGPAGGSGNTPPVNPPQGNPGGQGGGPSPNGAAGGGGAGAAGSNNPGGCGSGPGGAGLANSINGTPTLRAGGGGGAGFRSPGPNGSGGPGGGGAGGNPGPNPSSGGSAGVSGTVNTGGGAGAGGSSGSFAGGSGGSGIVIIRYKFQ